MAFREKKRVLFAVYTIVERIKRRHSRMYTLPPMEGGPGGGRLPAAPWSQRSAGHSRPTGTPSSTPGPGHGGADTESAVSTPAALSRLLRAWKCSVAWFTPPLSSLCIASLAEELRWPGWERAQEYARLVGALAAAGRLSNPTRSAARVAAIEFDINNRLAAAAAAAAVAAPPTGSRPTLPRLAVSG